jgi:L-methionine (R)-S-oxide reductase
MSFETKPIETADKAAFYAELVQQAGGLLHGETDRIANAANFAALAWYALPNINWCGFYFFDGKELVVGPFQGKPACVRIALGRGVCGTAASTRQTQVVFDVDEFPGHIACDAASRSEIVVPLLIGSELLGVWDVDSPEPGRFDADDLQGMQALCEVFLQACTQAEKQEVAA